LGGVGLEAKIQSRQLEWEEMTRVIGEMEADVDGVI
jgi:hypothetical protein